MIRFAEKKDIDDIMSFIDTYWRKGHILGRDREFFEYEHVFADGQVGYVISENDDGTIDAILGYIPYGNNHRDVMTVMWKANHTAHASLGLELFKYLKDQGDIRVMASPGSNPKLKGLYRYLGYQFGKMVQWYRLRPQEAYSIADVSDSDIPQRNTVTSYVHFDSWNVLEKYFDFNAYSKESKPYKESWYIEKRYFNHPIYHYEVYGVRNGSEKYPLLMVFRVDSVNDSGHLHLGSIG